MRWSILTDRLPTMVTIGEEDYELDTRTSTALNCLRKLREDIPDGVKSLYVTRRLGLPPDALDKAVWFLEGPNKPTGKGEASFDYFQDANVIYGAFQQAYGLGLEEVINLHWWAFLALLEAIPSGTRFMDIVGIRTMEIYPDDSAEVRRRKLRAKASVALKTEKKMEW
jgi:hypothetical protein